MTNERCTKHYDADGVPNSNITGCIWCAIDAYESEIKRLRALVPADEPPARLPQGTSVTLVLPGFPTMPREGWSIENIDEPERVELNRQDEPSAEHPIERCIKTVRKILNRDES